MSLHDRLPLVTRHTVTYVTRCSCGWEAEADEEEWAEEWLADHIATGSEEP